MKTLRRHECRLLRQRQVLGLRFFVRAVISATCIITVVLPFPSLLLLECMAINPQKCKVLHIVMRSLTVLCIVTGASMFVGLRFVIPQSQKLGFATARRCGVADASCCGSGTCAMMLRGPCFRLFGQRQAPRHCRISLSHRFQFSTTSSCFCAEIRCLS